MDSVSDKQVVKSGKLSMIFSAESFQKENLPQVQSALSGLSVERTSTNGVRASRGASKVLELENKQKLLLRKYMRGGLVRLINSNNFFKLPGQNSRAESEYEVVRHLSKSGVSVPKPRLVVIDDILGGVVYQAYIAFDYLENYKNFLVEAIQTPESTENFEKIALAAGQEAKKMLEAKVFHVDLHPGNVMFNPETSEVKLIDFDKAYFTDTENLAEKLIERWDRSVKKHGLPNSLSESFRQGISKHA